METNLIYGVKDKPSWGKVIVFALQQVLAILAATIAVPAVINNLTGSDMSQSAALFGAGVGTIIYLLFTKFKSPVFLGSSFAFIDSMVAAFAGAATMNLGYTGLMFGAILAGLVYVIIAFIIKKCGTAWVNKLLPPVIIGPTVAIIGLSLAGNAVGDLTGAISAQWYSYLLPMICGLVTLFTVIICSVFGKKMMKMIPFIIGICAGYVLASLISIIGYAANVDWLKIVDFTKFEALKEGSAWIPQFTFIKAFKGFKDFTSFGDFMSFFGTVAVAYVPVSIVVFTEHIADHKNLSSVIGQELLENPGLDNTLLGDGVGSMVGAFFGGCPNTTYGESVGCVAISGNASVITIICAAIMCIIISFFAPFTLFLATIPACVMGGVCFTLYGFIAVSGLKMLQPVDLNDKKNLFVASVIFIAGVGAMTLRFKAGDNFILVTKVACALILGIVTNLICSIGKKEEVKEYDADETEASIKASLEDE